MKARTERLRIPLSRLGIALIVIAANVTDSVWRTSELAEESFNSLAIVLSIVGCLGRVWCLAHISGRKNQELVTSGPYSVCRNPLYVFSVLGALGVAAGTCTLTIPAIVLLGFLSIYPSVVAAEESRLTRIHGEVFSNYRRLTPRFIPAIRLYRPAGRLTLDAAAFQWGLFDAAWFVLGVLGSHLIIEAHEAGYGKVLVKLF